jgi:hypothetical protein
MTKFDPEYLTFIQERIPIMKDIELQELVLDYCYNYSRNNIPIINRSNYLKKEYLSKISNRISQLNEYNIPNENINNRKNENNNTYIRVFGNRLIKVTNKNTSISGPFIEALINVTLFYYQIYNSSEIKSIIDCNFTKSSSGYLYQNMERIEFPTLFEFIVDLYNERSNIDATSKNRILLNVLLKISEQLNNLQNICGFIHGDFHSGNIFVNYLSDDNINIYFIDFGYSVVKLPIISNNSKEYILSSSQKFNLKYNSMNLYNNPNLRRIDLFHLFRDFYSLINSIININNFSSKLDIIKNKLTKNSNFKNFINKLFTKLNLREINNALINSEPHKYSRNINFIDSISENLSPLKFIELFGNNNNQIINNNIKNVGLVINSNSNSNNNNNNITRTPNSRVRGVKRARLFGNNSNNNKTPNSRVRGVERARLFGNNNN